MVDIRNLISKCAPVGEWEKKKKLLRIQRSEQERNVSVLLAHFEKAKKALETETKLLEILYNGETTCNCTCPEHCVKKTNALSQLKPGAFREGLKIIEEEEKRKQQKT